MAIDPDLARAILLGGLSLPPGQGGGLGTAGPDFARQQQGLTGLDPTGGAPPGQGGGADLETASGVTQPFRASRSGNVAAALAAAAQASEGLNEPKPFKQTALAGILEAVGAGAKSFTAARQATSENRTRERQDKLLGGADVDEALRKFKAGEDLEPFEIRLIEFAHKGLLPGDLAKSGLGSQAFREAKERETGGALTAEETAAGGREEKRITQADRALNLQEIRDEASIKNAEDLVLVEQGKLEVGQASILIQRRNQRMQDRLTDARVKLMGQQGGVAVAQAENYGEALKVAQGDLRTKVFKNLGFTPTSGKEEELLGRMISNIIDPAQELNFKPEDDALLRSMTNNSVTVATARATIAQARASYTQSRIPIFTQMITEQLIAEVGGDRAELQRRVQAGDKRLGQIMGAVATLSLPGTVELLGNQNTPPEVVARISNAMRLLTEAFPGVAVESNSIVSDMFDSLFGVTGPEPIAPQAAPTPGGAETAAATSGGLAPAFAGGGQPAPGPVSVDRSGLPGAGEAGVPVDKGLSEPFNRLPPEPQRPGALPSPLSTADRAEIQELQRINKAEGGLLPAEAARLAALMQKLPKKK